MLPEPFWQSKCGGYTLYCGDCLDILPHLPKVDAVVTDPPYGVEKSTSRIREKTWRNATNYAADFCDSPDYISAVVLSAIEVCRERAECVAVSPGFKCLNLYPRANHIGGFYYQGQSTVTAWGAAWWQPILFYGRDPKTGMLQRDMFIGRSNPSGAGNGHPCPKEENSWQLLVERMSFEDDTVCDPFTGSGTTGVACIRLGRKFIGIELEPKYCVIARDRMIRELQQPRLFNEAPVKETQKELVLS